MKLEKDLLKKVLDLTPGQKMLLIEALVESLDKPNEYVQEVWLKEAESRLEEHRKGKSKGFDEQEVFGESL